MADLVRITVASVLLIGFAMVLGFRLANGFAGALGGLALAAIFGFAACWPMAYLGVVSRRPESVSTFGFLVLLPLLFASSVFVPVDSMPGWLASLVEVNPVTPVADAVRGLMIGGAVATPVTLSAAWIAGIVLVFGFLALRRYRERT